MQGWIKDKGYKECEIIDAVIHAISPSLKLRSYLQTMKELTLAKLRQMLRAHYKQKSGTELLSRTYNNVPITEGNSPRLLN